MSGKWRSPLSRQLPRGSTVLCHLQSVFYTPAPASMRKRTPHHHDGLFSFGRKSLRYIPLAAHSMCQHHFRAGAPINTFRCKSYTQVGFVSLAYKINQLSVYSHLQDVTYVVGKFHCKIHNKYVQNHIQMLYILTIISSRMK